MKSTRAFVILYLIMTIISSCNKDSSEQKTTDQLQNPGFENSLTGWQATSPNDFTADTAAKKSGQYGLKFMATSTPWNGNIVQTLHNLPDGEYTFSVYGKGSGIGMYLWADGGADIASTPIQKVYLDSVYPMPLNTLKFKVTGGTAKIGFICINASQDSTKQTVHVLEAETAVLNKAVANADHAGFTGAGFADFINNSDDFIEWTFNKVDSGSVLLQFRYANGSTTDRPLKLEVNNVVVNSNHSFLPTGGWSKWTTVSDTVRLKAGTNKIKLTATGASGANIDNLSWSNLLGKPYFYADDVQLSKLP